MFQGCFKEVSRVFQESFKCISKRFQGCFKKVSRVFNGVFARFQGCTSMHVLGKFQRCLKDVLRKF